MATSVTLHENKFLRLLAEYEDRASITTIACPGIVEFVERGILDGPELSEYLMSLFKDALNDSIDAVVLGCTHYPFVRKAIAGIVGENVFIIDGGNGTARETLHQLKVHNICAPADNIGTVSLENSNSDMIPLMETLLRIEE